MHKYIVLVFAFFACVNATPGLLPAPLLAAAPAPFVTATSSQVVARNYNGIAAAPIVAPVAPVVPFAKVVAAPVAAPLIAPLSPTLNAAPITPFISPYVAAPVVARYFK